MSDDPGGPTDEADEADEAESPFADVGPADDADGGSGDHEPDDPFADIEPADEDVWARLSTGDEPTAEDGDLFERLAEPGTDDTPDVERDGADAVVPKSRYCQNCRFFSDPPDTRCLNPDTEIVEVVDSEHFQVRNCPVVAERQEATDVLDLE